MPFADNTTSNNRESVIERTQYGSTSRPPFRHIVLDPPAILTDLLPPFVRERLWIDYSHKNVDQMLPSLLRAFGMGDTESGRRD
jgi:hypothetical protein